MKAAALASSARSSILECEASSTKAGARGIGASGRIWPSWGFFVGPTREGTDVGARVQALPGKREQDGDRGAPRDRVGRRDPGADGRPQVLRPARLVAAHDAAGVGVRGVRLRRRSRLRRLVDPRLAGHLGVGHVADARSRLGHPRPVHGGADPFAALRDRRPRDPAAVRPRPARGCPPSRGVPREERHRRHRLLRARMRVFRPRRGLVRPRAEPRALRIRLGRRALELGQGRARLHGPREGGLLPAGSARHAPRPAHADGPDARARRHPVRVPPPRGRLGRPVRDRPSLRDADPHGRPGHDLQVRDQERRPDGGQDGDDGYAGLSDIARFYIGGLLAHAPALLAFCAPTTNSYRRLVPGYEAPVNLVYSQRNRSACIRIPMYSDSPKAKRIEFRCPDATANPYLAFSAMLLAGLDGIQRGLDPGAPADYDLFEDGGRDVPQVPGSLPEALDALEADHEFLLPGGVFSEELIRTWIAWKREHEVDVVRLRPHPAEFGLYFDA